jgi:hypothetical protein
MVPITDRNALLTIPPYSLWVILGNEAVPVLEHYYPDWSLSRFTALVV